MGVAGNPHIVLAAGIIVCAVGQRTHLLARLAGPRILTAIRGMPGELFMIATVVVPVPTRVVAAIIPVPIVPIAILLTVAIPVSVAIASISISVIPVSIRGVSPILTLVSVAFLIETLAIALVIVEVAMEVCTVSRQPLLVVVYLTPVLPDVACRAMVGEITSQIGAIARQA